MAPARIKMNQERTFMYAKTILIAALLACGAYASASPPADEGKAPAEPAAAPTAGSTTPATATSAAPTSADTTNTAASPATPAAASGSSPQAPATEDGKSKNKKKKGKKELDPMTADLAELREAGYKIVKQENGEELLCRREPEPGSRVKMRTLCYTRAELKEMSLANRNEMLKMKAHGADGGG